MPRGRSLAAPLRRARKWGSTACVIASTPKVLVSNTSRTLATGVASKAPKSPIPSKEHGVHGGSDGGFVVATSAATRRTLYKLKSRFHL